MVGDYCQPGYRGSLNEQWELYNLAEDRADVARSLRRFPGTNSKRNSRVYRAIDHELFNSGCNCGCGSCSSQANLLSPLAGVL